MPTSHSPSAPSGRPDDGSSPDAAARVAAGIAELVRGSSAEAVEEIAARLAADPVFWEPGASLLLEQVAAAASAEARRRAELAAGAERNRLLLEESADVVYTMDVDGRFTWVSREVEELIGVPPEELGGRHYSFILAPGEELAAAARLASKIAGNAETTRYETTLFHRDGRRVIVDVHSRRIEEDGVPVGVQGIIRDVTESRRSKLVLEGQRRLLELATHGASLDAIVEAVEATVQELAPGARCSVALDGGEPLAESLSVDVTGADGARLGAIGVSLPNGRAAFEDEQRTLELLARTVGLAVGRLRAEEARQRAYDNLSELVEACPAAIVAVDTKGLVTAWNPAAERLFGWTAAEAIGRPTPNARGREDEFRELAARIKEGEVLSDRALVRARKDGTDVEVTVASSVLRDDRGEVVGVLGLYTDTSDRRRAESELRDAEARYRVLVEQLPFVTYIDDAEPGRPLHYVSPQVETTFGYRADEWTSEPPLFRHILHPEDRDRVVAEMEAARAADGHRSSEYRLRTRDGRYRWIRDECRPVHDEAGDRLYLQGYLTDITEKRRASQLLHAQLRLLELIATGSPLPDVLNECARLVEEQSEARDRCSILLVDSEGRLRDGAAPSLPSEYRVAIEGLEIGDEHGSCGTAAFRGEPVVAADIATHPYWEAYRELALPHGLRSCWSIPIHSSQGDVMGTFAVYGDEPGEPSGDDLRVATIAAQLAGIAIEKWRAESAVHETSNALARLIESAPAPIVALDRDGNVTEWNPAAERIFQWTRAEVVGRPLPNIDEADRASSSRLQARALAGESWTGIELRRRRKDGELLDLSTSTSPLRGADGEIVGMITVIADITSEKRMREDLESAEARYRSLVERMPLATYVSAAAEPQILYMSPQVVTLLGYTHDEWRTNEDLVDDVVHPDDLAVAREAAERVRTTEESQRAEYRVLTKDGRSIWVLDQMTSIAGPDGRPSFIQGFLLEITDRKLAEEEVARLGRQIELLLDSAGEGIVALDGKGRVTMVNPAAVRMLGWDEEELIGQQLHLLAHHSRPDGSRFPREECPTTLAFRGETHHVEDDLFWRKDGTSFPVVSTSTPIREGEAIVGAAVVFRDVSAHRALEEQLRQSQKMEAVGRLAGGIAHDFNNLLTAITGYVELAQHRLGGGDSALRHDLEEVGRAASRAASLTRQLLAFSRRQVMLARVIDLNGVVVDMEKMLRRLIGEDIELTVELDDGLDPVKADPGQLEQVVVNLAVNARDAMPSGGRLVIRTENVDGAGANLSLHPAIAGRGGSWVVLTVTDTGHGMDQATLERVFEPFFTTKQVGEGTGLGLSTAYGIVKQSGGELVASSVPGRGTTFFVYLPRAEEAPVASGSGAQRLSLPLGSETLLLVEDEDVVRGLVAEVLRGRGYRVLEARNGFEALEVGADFEGSIHMLLTDVVMPGMSGRELSEALVPLRPDMQVLYMSGYTDDALVSHGVLQGPAFLQKPFSMDALVTKVRELLDVAVVARKPRR